MGGGGTRAQFSHRCTPQGSQFWALWVRGNRTCGGKVGHEGRGLKTSPPPSPAPW